MNFTRVCRYVSYSMRTGRRHDPTSTLTQKLTEVAAARGYKSEAWGTLHDVQRLAGKVRYGEASLGVPHGVMVKWYNAEQLEDPVVAKPPKEKNPFLP